MTDTTTEIPSQSLSRREFLTLGAISAASAAGLVAFSRAAFAIAEKGAADLELCYMPATELLAKFKAKELSPVEVLKAQIARTDAVEETLNNFTYLYPEEALDAARASEARYMKGEALPLDGLTCAIKDEMEMKGRHMTAGSKVLADNIAKKNDPLTDRLLRDGAIIHGTTTVPEMYFITQTWTDLFGVTRNPWNTEYTVGGSSGGAGGALAAGQTTLATGSDMGGSIRIPAAVCGVYGFKPPYGRVPASKGTTFLLPSTSGPMARTLKDMILLENNMAGPTPQSLTALRPKLELPLEYPGVKGMKIGYMVDQGWAVVDPETEALFTKAIEGLRAQGATVEAVDINIGMTGPELRVAITKALLSGSFGGQMKMLNEHADQLTSYGRYFAEVAATGMGPDEALEAANIQEELNIRIQDAVFTKGYAALLMPTTNTSRMPADFDPTQDSLEINGQVVDPHTGWVQTPLWNLLNWYPVLNAPIGLTPYSMPAGMQIIANTFDDATCMQVAAAHAVTMDALYTGDRLPKIG